MLQHLINGTQNAAAELGLHPSDVFIDWDTEPTTMFEVLVILDENSMSGYIPVERISELSPADIVQTGYNMVYLLYLKMVKQCTT